MRLSGIGLIFSLILAIGMFVISTRCNASLFKGNSMSFTLQSKAFSDGSSIPTKYTCTAEDISPPLAWEGAPEKTKSFVLIMDDPDAPGGTWDHWIVFNIPETVHAFSENLMLLPEGALQGKNSWGKSVYGGPCPPSGEHRYYFKLYALDNRLNLPEGASKSEVESAMQGHVLADATVMGRYKK